MGMKREESESHGCLCIWNNIPKNCKFQPRILARLLFYFIIILFVFIEGMIRWSLVKVGFHNYHKNITTHCIEESHNQHSNNNNNNKNKQFIYFLFFSFLSRDGRWWLVSGVPFFNLLILFAMFDTSSSLLSIIPSFIAIYYSSPVHLSPLPYPPKRIRKYR